MTTVYAPEPLPLHFTKSIFLAGPSPRSSEHYNWRKEALLLLEASGFDGVVFLPIPRQGKFPDQYETQVSWEQSALDRSDVILFWIPRDLKTLPGFTTNVEFGQRYLQRNVILGYPPEAPKNRYLRYLAEREDLTCTDTLSATIDRAVQMVEEGAHREGGECEVPLQIWRHPTFSDWLHKHKAVGNRLDGFRVLMQFGDYGPSPFFWAAQVKVFIKAENRIKENEIIVARPDILHTVGYRPATHLPDTEVVLVREFRSPGRTSDGFIREIPGGSAYEQEAPSISAAREFTEETGITVHPDRLKSHGTRQLAGTNAVQVAHLFSVELSLEEMEQARRDAKSGVSKGVAEEDERTYLEVHTLSNLLQNPLTDWANLGMLMEVLMR